MALTVGSDNQVLTACAAATSGLCWVTPPTPVAAIPCSVLTAKGSLVAASAASTPANLVVGTDGQVLVACSTDATGLCWVSPPAAAIPCSCITAKGALVTGTAPGTLTPLTVGTNGQVLTACSTETSGLCWATPATTAAATLAEAATGTSTTLALTPETGVPKNASGMTGAAILPNGTTVQAPAVTAGYTRINNDLGQLTFVANGCYFPVGFGAGGLTTTTAVGLSALALNTGADNVAVGANALAANTSGTNNSAIGSNALRCSTTGGSNVAIGQSALFSNTTGGASNAIGFNALRSATNGGDNNAFGFNTMCSNTSGFQNTALGHVSMCSVTTGSQNTAVGSTTLCAFTTGCVNDAFGTLALSAFTTGCYNVALGGFSLFNYVSGDFSTAVGHRSLTAATGSCNTAIGAFSGENITTGTCNVMLGHYAHAASATASCQLTIAYATGAWWMRGDGARNVCIGAGLRDSGGSLGNTSQYLWSTATGICWASSSPSDARDKVIHGAIETALPLVNSIDVVSYNWKPRTTGIEEQELVYGFVAQQLQEVDPILVDAEDPENLRIHDRKITPLLVRAIQELSEEVKNLREELNKLKVQG